MAGKDFVLPGVCPTCVLGLASVSYMHISFGSVIGVADSDVVSWRVNSGWLLEQKAVECDSSGINGLSKVKKTTKEI